MGNNGLNMVSVIIVIAIIAALVLAIRSIWKRKGQCAYCDRKNSCPYKLK